MLEVREVYEIDNWNSFIYHSTSQSKMFIKYPLYQVWGSLLDIIDIEVIMADQFPM